MLRRRLTYTLAGLSLACAGGTGVCASELPPAPADSAAAAATTITAAAPAALHPEWGANYSTSPWPKQLLANGFRINDPSVNYPRFMRWVLAVYNWGDRTFNSYDPDYVVGTGKNWKLSLTSNNWIQGYTLLFPEGIDVMMFSDIYSDLTPSINFMAVGLSYSFNANELFRRPVALRRNFEWNFTCALFSLRYSDQQTDGGVTITRFGNFNDGHHINRDFNDVRQKSKSLIGYYFFNHNHYSHAAAYCYSKYQLRSAGSLICGFNYERRKVAINFSSLPADMLEYVPDERMDYRWNYTDYGVVIGYGYNCVMHPRRWLFNITTLPALGYKHVNRESSDNRKDMFSANLDMMFTFVYNHRALFSSLCGRFDGSLYLGENYTFFNHNFALALTVGMRF